MPLVRIPESCKIVDCDGDYCLDCEEPGFDVVQPERGEVLLQLRPGRLCRIEVGEGEDAIPVRFSCAEISGLEKLRDMVRECLREAERHYVRCTAYSCRRKWMGRMRVLRRELDTLEWALSTLKKMC